MVPKGAETILPVALTRALLSQTGGGLQTGSVGSHCLPGVA